ncbi:rhodanese-like domain-containing protein [Ekhidna sp.]|uniref:rhodanese-like domain-containing protein n=1 Tax=Ekhidna sp. TaxID=2608089 RepID=UPI00329850F9
MQSISVTELSNLIHSDTKLIIIDVRSVQEFEKAHLPNARNVPLPELEEELKVWKGDTKMITVCTKGGGRSSKAASLLRDHGFSSAFLEGGTIAWLELQSA